MGAYVIRRLIQSAVLLFIVASLVAIFIQFLPGDPAYIILGEQAGPERVVAVREELGLNEPIWVQYTNWISGVARGDLGTSLISGREIAPDLLTRLPRTFELIGAAIIIGLVVGIPAGVLAAKYHNRMPDIVLSLISLIGMSTPTFVSGTLMLLIFGLHLGWIRATGYVGPTENLSDHLQRLLLPALVLGVREAAVTLRMVRSSLLEVLGEDYVRTARAKGLGPNVVIFRHALRNSLIPVIAILGVQAGQMLAGTVLVEFIFNWPGISTYLFSSINDRDYPAVQGILLLTATILILLNLLTDLIYAVVDPRIKYA